MERDALEMMALSNAEKQQRYRQTHPNYERQRNHKRAEYRRTYKRRTRANDSTSVSRMDAIRFVAFDGEGSDGRYQLFACSTTDRYIAKEEGLSTLDILNYMASLYRHHDVESDDVLVGYGLSYDFDNILRDIPDERYADLLEGEEVWYYGNKLRLIGKKLLMCDFHYINGKRKQWVLQDVLGYFQTSFLNACDQWHIELPPMVEEYKAKRGTFEWSDIKNIVKYNRMELDALVRLMDRFKVPMFEAFRDLGIHGRFSKSQWYGPGSQAQSILEATNVGKEQPSNPAVLRERALAIWNAGADSVLYVEPTPMMKPKQIIKGQQVIKSRQAIQIDPWAIAYYGGRIETAMKGHVTGRLYDYDIASAYPFALTNVPPIAGKKLIPIDRLDPLNRIGIYYLEWQNEERRDYNPFPYRNKGGAVSFPDACLGWYMSPEVLAVAETTPEAMHIREGFVIEGTEGYGSGLVSGDSAIAKMIRQAAERRVQLKAEGNDAHISLKLVLNSVYGKTLQAVGKTTNRNGFLAAWITSVCRAMIWRAISNMPLHSVLFIQTDGILTNKPIKLQLSDALGGWGVTEYDEAYVYQPGVYELLRNGESMMERTRGVHRNNLEGFRGHYADGVEVYDNVYVTRKLAMACPKTYGPYLHRFVQVKKLERFPLERKRQYSPLARTVYEEQFRKKEVHWYPPISSSMPMKDWLSWMPEQPSYPYLHVLQLLEDVIQATEESEMMEDPHAVVLSEEEAMQELEVVG